MQNTTSKNKIEPTTHNELLLNTLHTTCKLSMNSIEDVITLAKNTNFQNAISETHSRYEVIRRECQMLAKAQNHALTPVDCFTKFKNWATVRLESFCDCSTQKLAKILYGGTCCEIAEVLVQMTNCEQADKDILSLAEKLSSLQEHHIHELKKYLTVKDDLA
jgi:hypothetical protein